MNHSASLSPTVLVVDDEPMIRQVIGCFLRSRDIVVIEASNGTEALQLTRVEEVHPHLVILDVVMPGMSGPALLKELRRDEPNLPALFVSGYCNEPAELERAINERTHFLEKPFNFKVLELEVNSLLQRHQAGLIGPERPQQVANEVNDAAKSDSG